MTNKCIFELAWIGKCGKETHLNTSYCEEHLKEKCRSCGEKATKQCDSTQGPLVCGYSLCNDCEHELDENGTAGYHSRHCRKDKQKYVFVDGNM